MKNMKYKNYYIAILFIICLFGSFFFGVIVGSLKIYPDELFGNSQFTNDSQMYEQIDPLYNMTNVSSLISINNENDVITKRRRLVHFIWGDNGFPDTQMPYLIEKGIIDDRFSNLNNLRKIDKIIVMMDYEINSIIYLFHPIHSNNKLIIYHQGHGGDFILGKNTIQFFLNRAFSVMAISMPLTGMNNQPIVDLQSFGKLKLASHDHLKFLKENETSLSPIRFFVEPIAISLNYVEKFGFKSISMIGISGGGWTTILYSAIDPRISTSYPVAGSLPIYLRSNSTRDWGDYEQTLPELYQVANYLELYILSSYGDGRKQLQVLNKYDSHCFAGVKYRTYEGVIKAVMDRLGKGNFEVYLDDTHKEHKISDNALVHILNDLENSESEMVR